MRIFSGRYPKDLAKVVDHAKRMKDLFEELERVRTDAWFFGRADELRGVVALAVADWRRGARDVEATRTAILAHVDELHRGAAKRLRCGLALDCCEVDEAITFQGEDEGESVAEPDAPPTGVSRPTNGPTVPAGWVDRPEMLARFREGLGLVEVHARSLARNLGSGSPTIDDLRGFGQEGLLLAARAFDERRGVPFEKWATVRVRNAIVDGMRSWGSNRVRTRETSHGLAPAGTEESPSDWQIGSQPARAGDVEEPFDGALPSGPTGAPAAIVDGLASPSATAEELLAKAQLESTVRNLVVRLPGRGRSLMERIYFQGQSLEQAAVSLGVTRAWARRVHDQALEKIQGELQKREAVAPGGRGCRRTRS